MTPQLHRADYLDLEWFLHHDTTRDPHVLAARDRAIGQAAQAAGISDDAYLPFWLDALRTEHTAPLPSQAYRTARMLCAWILATLGLLAGFSLTQGLLQYSGTAPINVFVFLAVAVFLQALLCLIAAGMLVMRMRQRATPPRDSIALILLRRLTDQLMRRATTSLTGWNKLATHGKCGVLFLLDALMLTQLMGVAFAGGTLLGTLVSVATTDLAFGWQSTLNIGPAGLHTLVSAIALPWAWLPDTWNIIPSMEQIEGSRIILKDGIGHLHSTHLIAWWKFLAMSVLVYALLPRMAVLSWTYVLLRRAEMAFSHPLHEHIILRMRSPLIDMPRTVESPSQPLLLAPSPVSASFQDATVPEPPTEFCLILVPEELLPRLDTHATARLGRELGCAHIETHPLPDDANALRSVFAACPEGPRRVVLLIEAWQPPIQENRRALAELLRPDITPHTVAVLTGRPHTNTWLTPPTRSDFEVWSTALAAIAPIAVHAVGQDQ